MYSLLWPIKRPDSDRIYIPSRAHKYFPQNLKGHEKHHINLTKNCEVMSSHRAAQSWQGADHPSQDSPNTPRRIAPRD